MEKNKRDNLTKKDIANTKYSYFGVSTLYARKILDDTINILIAGLKKNGTLKINKFGSFKVKYKKKRTGRNPKNKQMHEISSRKIISFKISTYLKNKINND